IVADLAERGDDGNEIDVAHSGPAAVWIVGVKMDQPVRIVSNHGRNVVRFGRHRLDVQMQSKMVRADVSVQVTGFRGGVEKVSLSRSERLQRDADAIVLQ